MAKKRRLKRGKAYMWTWPQARVRGFTYRQWRNSVSAKERWERLPEEKKKKIINNLKRARVGKKNKIEFKVYGYEKTSEGTATKIEAILTYIGDKTEEELEAIKDELWREAIREVGKNTKKTYKVSIGFVEKEEVRSNKEELTGKFVVLGIGNAAGRVIKTSERELTEFL